MGGKSKSKQSTTSTQTNTNIVNDGEYAGNSGTITLSDSGAIDAASDIATKALDINESVLSQALDSNGNVLDLAFEFGSEALDFGSEALDFGSQALSSNENVLNQALEFGSEALDEVQVIATSAIDNATEQSTSFADSLSSVTKASLSANQQVLENAAQSNTDDKKLIAELAKSTSLAGQDLIAKSSERMTLYMAVALCFGFVAMIIFGRR